MQTVTITKVYRTDKDKEGKPLIGKSGRAYERLAIKTQEYGEQWLSGFGGQWNEGWKEGDAVTLTITEVKSGDKVYLNFEQVNKEAVLEAKLKELEHRVQILENNTSAPTTEIDMSDVPF